MQQCVHNDLEFVSAANGKSMACTPAGEMTNLEYEVTGWILVCRGCGALVGGQTVGHMAEAVKAHMKGWHRPSEVKNSGF